MAEDLTVYYSSVAVNSKLQIKNKQSKIFRILDSKGIPYKKVDISVGDEVKQEMRDRSGDSKALPPRIFRGDQYLGGFDEFDEAVELEELNNFLKIS